MRKLLSSIVLAAAAFAATPVWLPAQQPAPVQADVPVKAVVLFSSGVGYFEHFGSVKGDGSTQLNFKTQQINDILKSLVLQDLDGGKVTTITYPSQDPIEKTLRSFQVDITKNPPLADLLNQLRGAKVTISQPNGEKFVGTILGVEKKTKVIAEKQTIDFAVLNLLTSATIRAVELDQIASIDLDDPRLQDELTRALTALAQARDQDKKPVNISFTGQGDRRVRIGYVVETPIWKTSYRLLLPGGGAQDKPRLQGWAIVENQTDNDWNDVQLSLVSGRPISFIQDLYQPLYIPRPVVVPELYASLMPQQYAAGREEAKKPETFARRQRGVAADAVAEAAPAATAAPGAGGGFALKQNLEQPMDASSSVASVASAAKIGELFQYTVGNVSLPRQKSAMLPIITDEVEVEKLSIYNQSVLPRNPLNGARVKNTTNKHLLTGPITVLEGASYAGDAQIDNVPPGQERLLSYGIDLQVLVDASPNRAVDQIQTGKIIKGVLHVTRKLRTERDYAIDNKSDRDKTIIIEHPIRHGWHLVDTDKPVETTDALYRFKGDVGAGKASKLTVKEEIIQGEEFAILSADFNSLIYLSRQGEIPEKVRNELVKVAQMKQAVVETDRRINECSQQIDQITQEQNRIRENMKTVDRNGQYYKRLETKLNEQESKIEALQVQREELIAKKQGQQKELEDYLSNLNVG